MHAYKTRTSAWGGLLCLAVGSTVSSCADSQHASPAAGAPEAGQTDGTEPASDVGADLDTSPPQADQRTDAVDGSGGVEDGGHEDTSADQGDGTDSGFQDSLQDEPDSLDQGTYDDGVDSPEACIPNWTNVTECNCVPSRCESCTGVILQEDGCGSSQEIGCTVPAECALCCDTKCCGAGQGCEDGSCTTLIYEQPVITDVDQRIMIRSRDGTDQPLNRTFVWVDGLGSECLSYSIAWPVGDFTGFYPIDPVAAQRGADPGSYGSNSVQIEGAVIGIQNHPATGACCTGYLPGDIVSVVHNFSPGFEPWVTNPAARVRFSAEVQFPSADKRNGAEVFYTFVFLVYDRSSGRAVWYQASVFDLDREPSTDWIHVDPETQQVVVSSPIRDGQSYFARAPGSYSFSSSTWSGFRYYGFEVDWPRFQAAIVQANQGSSNPLSLNASDYVFLHFNAGVEIYWPYTDSFAYGGMSVRGIRILLLE